MVAAFQIEGWPVRGRIARLSSVVDDILNRHAYPEPVANLLGEACALAALVGSSLKFEGRLIVQAQGDGPVAYVVAKRLRHRGLPARAIAGSTPRASPPCKVASSAPAPAPFWARACSS